MFPPIIRVFTFYLPLEQPKYLVFEFIFFYTILHVFTSIVYVWLYKIMFIENEQACEIICLFTFLVIYSLVHYKTNVINISHSEYDTRQQLRIQIKFRGIKN